ncbi:hypothetical protein HY637_04720, partial [Candidatus Woesearchaeota archaeon]|nr:hypothetical protein [Candidatus Woesearchaeota archaeon]
MKKITILILLLCIFSVFAASAFAQSSNLIAAYSFNEGSGTTLGDSSGNGLNGAVSGATWTAGKYGNGLNFDGTNDWVTVNDAASLDLTSSMTLEAWVYPTAINSDWRTVMLKEMSGGLAYSLYATDGANRPPAVYARIGYDRSAVGTSVLPLNAWTHLTGTYSSGALRLYVNGNLVRTTSVSGSMATSSNPLRIGGNSVWGEWFKGKIDEIRIYNRVLSQAEIQSDMNTPIGGQQALPIISSFNATPSSIIAGENSTLAWSTINATNVSINQGIGAVAASGSINVAPAATTTYTLTATNSGGSVNQNTIVFVSQPPDTTSPTANLTSPASGSTVSGTINVVATATDNVGVAGVQFLLDGANLGSEDTTSPYSVSWNTASSSNGQHTLQARARDAAGNLGFSSLINVTVDNFVDIT